MERRINPFINYLSEATLVCAILVIVTLVSYTVGYDEGINEKLKDKEIQDLIYQYCKHGVNIEQGMYKYHVACLPIGDMR